MRSNARLRVFTSAYLPQEATRDTVNENTYGAGLSTPKYLQSMEQSMLALLIIIRDSYQERASNSLCRHGSCRWIYLAAVGNGPRCRDYRHVRISHAIQLDVLFGAVKVRL
jgi:hypothetical protein